MVADSAAGADEVAAFSWLAGFLGFAGFSWLAAVAGLLVFAILFFLLRNLHHYGDAGFM